MKDLSCLNFSDNKIKHLSSEFNKIKNIIRTRTTFRSIEEIPKNFDKPLSIILQYKNLDKIPKEIFKYKDNIESLSITGNMFKEIPKEIFSFKILKNLNFNSNLIEEIPREIMNLKKLKTLILSNNQIKYIPKEICYLIELKELDLSGNYIEVIPSEIGDISNLQILNLRENKITKVPLWIKNLQKLKDLYLDYNQIKELPTSLMELKKLENLNLEYNKIDVLPKDISQLNNLIELNLSNNYLYEIPKISKGFNSLKSIDISHNKLSNIIRCIINLDNLENINLNGNDLVNPPIEIASKGLKSLRNYYKQLDECGIDYIYEAKLILIGEPEAGKTTLAKKIQNRDYKLNRFEKTTSGINMIKWGFKIENDKFLKVNIWDFGGQEIYHNTHQFFLTKRSLYILVADSRKEDTDFFHWLNTIDLLSQNSPIIIVNNEKDDRRKEIPISQLKYEFKSLQDNVLRTNLADNRGLDNIIKTIKFRIVNLPHIGNPLPKSWVRVRRILEKDTSVLGHKSYN